MIGESKQALLQPRFKAPLGQVRKHIWSPGTEMLILALVVGLIGGAGSIFFKKMILLWQGVFWGAHLTPFDAHWLRRLINPVIGGCLVGPLIYFLAREAKGHGVPEVMIAVITQNSVIRPMVVVVKILASALCIGSGGSVGREGPIVQIGAAAASTMGQWLHVKPVQLKTLVGCGVAAGIAATFNAPMAGMLFALELIVSDFGLTAFTPILVSAVTATAITRHFHGNLIAFGDLSSFHLVSLWEFGLYLILGMIAGGIGLLFSWNLYAMDDLLEKTRIPGWIRPAFGGLLVGIMALHYPHVMGVGYDSIKRLMDGHIIFVSMAALVLLKILATSITIGSGGSGGILAPSLFIGAMLGGAFGTVVHHLFPTVTAEPGAYALVGMAAVNGACTLAPLSAIVILVELTGNYNMILPLMFTVVMATYVSRRCNPESIYTRKLARRGIQAHHGEDLNVLRSVKVTVVLRHDEAVIAEKASFNELLGLSLEQSRNVIFAVDDDHRPTGVISFQVLKHVLNTPEALQNLLNLKDVMQPLAPVRLNDTLDTVLDAFADSGLDRLPVVDQDGRLAGSVIMSDALRRYHQEVANRNLAVELGARIHAHDQSNMLHIGGDTVVAEIEVPRWMVNQKLGDLNLRSKRNVSVFLVKERMDGPAPRIVTPGASYVFREGDTLLVGGQQAEINALSSKTP